jgi:seryl-tRNA synthetase
MISLFDLINNPDKYKNELTRRFKDPLIIDTIVTLESQYKTALQELESLRTQKNEFNKIIITLAKEEKASRITEMKIVSDNIAQLDEKVKNLKKQIDELLYQIPNITWAGMPVARDSDGNVEIAAYGKKPDFDFEARNYYDLDIFKRDYLSQKGVEASGFRGFYIQGELARFQQALFNWTLDRLISKGFNYVIPPVFVNEEVMQGTGFFPTGRDDVYEVIDGNNSRYLPGTSEAALMFLHSNETLSLLEPKKLTAWTRCFRKEAGAYGKDTKGGIRVTQFEKIETVYLCRPEDSYKVFEEMTETFHETLNLLDLYYHDLETSTGDNSNKNHRMIDIEAWFPAQGKFRELASSSNCTDYQTRTLNIKCHNADGDVVLAHSLNCTGITNRTLFAIMEQNQQSDGRIKVPAVLVEKFGKEYIE